MSLVTHERITTTLPKAWDLGSLAEKTITLGKRGDFHVRRLARKNLPDSGAVRKLERLFRHRWSPRIT